MTLADARDAYNFVPGAEYVLDRGTWRPQRRRDRVRFWLRRKLRLGLYTRCASADPVLGIATFETVRFSWLRLKWVVA